MDHLSTRTFSFPNTIAAVTLMATCLGCAADNSKSSEVSARWLISTVEIARGQTARLSVVHLGTDESCRVKLAIRDSAGTELTGGVVTLSGREPAFLQLDAATLVGTSERAQLRAEATTSGVGSTGDGEPCQALLHSLEVLDSATGETLLVHAGASYGPPLPGQGGGMLPGSVPEGPGLSCALACYLTRNLCLYPCSANDQLCETACQEAYTSCLNECS